MRHNSQPHLIYGLKSLWRGVLCCQVQIRDRVLTSGKMTACSQLITTEQIPKLQSQLQKTPTV